VSGLIGRAISHAHLLFDLSGHSWLTLIPLPRGKTALDVLIGPENLSANANGLND
jgi:hypothetical protein